MAEPKYVDKKQKLLVECLCSNREIFLKTYKILNKRYFDEPLDSVIDYVKNHYDEYSNLPDLDFLEAETNVTVNPREVPEEDAQFIIDELETHCRQQAMRFAVLDSIDDIEGEDYTSLDARFREAMMVRVDNNIGTDVFEDPANRVRMMEDSSEQTSFGYDVLDDLSDGGPRRGELIIFAMQSGVGKSVTLANLVRNFAKDGKDCLVVSLEMNENRYSRRFDSIITGIPIKETIDRLNDLDLQMHKASQTYGKIYVKRTNSGLTASQLRAIIMEYHLVHGKYPDVLATDYLDIMGCDDRRLTGKFDMDERKTFDLRDIGLEFNMYNFTASQLNRDATDVKDINYSHVAGGLSKVNGSDLMFGGYQSEEDVDNNIINFLQLKIRDGEKTNRHVQLFRCPRTVRLYDVDKAPTTSGHSSPLLSKKSSDTVKKDDAKNESKVDSETKIETTDRGSQKLRDALKFIK